MFSDDTFYTTRINYFVCIFLLKIDLKIYSISAKKCANKIMILVIFF